MSPLQYPVKTYCTFLNFHSILRKGKIIFNHILRHYAMFAKYIFHLGTYASQEMATYYVNELRFSTLSTTQKVTYYIEVSITMKPLRSEWQKNLLEVLMLHKLYKLPLKIIRLYLANP